MDSPGGAIHIALASDRTYLPWCAVAVSSCQRSTARPLQVHVLEEGDLTAADRDRFRTMVERAHGRVTFHRVDANAVATLPSKGPAFGGRTSWLRIFLPDRLPDVDRVVYLDADTLVVDSIEPLWSMPLTVPIAAVANVVEPAKRQQVRNLGIRDPAQYFNAGVLVMDLARMRGEHTLATVLDFVAGRAELPWYDQDALNAVFAGRWHPLPPRWNAQNSLWYWDDWATDVFGERAVEEAVTNPAIVHFEGPAMVKPWHYLSEHPYTEPYLRALAATPWAGTRLVERTRATRVIRHLPPPVPSRRLRATPGLPGAPHGCRERGPRMSGASGSERVLVVIPVYGHDEMTHDVLRDLHRERELADVVVVDNRGDYQPVGDEHVLRPGANLGWAGGTNHGTLEARRDEHVGFVWLNNDTRLSPGFVAGLLRAWRATRAGLLAPVYDCYWVHQRAPETPPVNAYEPRPIHSRARFVDGTCMFVPATTVDAIGVLDDETFAPIGWGADIDYALRARAAGLDVVITRLSYLHHEKSVTGKTVFDGIEGYAAEGDPVFRTGLREKWGDWRRLTGIDASTGNTKPLGRWARVRRPRVRNRKGNRVAIPAR